MRTRNWIAVMSLFVFIAAAVVIGQSALATPELNVKSELELNALSPVFPSGGQAELEVLVGPEALGGYAELYAKVDGQVYEVLNFPICEPAFVIQAPVPSDPELLGRKLTFQYAAFAPDGSLLGRSKKADGLVIEPDVE